MSEIILSGKNDASREPSHQFPVSADDKLFFGFFQPLAAIERKLLMGFWKGLTKMRTMIVFTNPKEIRRARRDMSIVITIFCHL